jgi:hypothetical protein
MIGNEMQPVVNPRNTNQAGFTLVEGVVIAVVVLFFAFVGWWVWQKSTNDDTNNDKSASQVPITETGEGDKKSFFVTPETDEQKSSVPAATSDPQTEAVVAKLLQEQGQEKEYCSVFEKACFTYPGKWTLDNRSTSEREEVELTSQNGTHLLWRTHVSTPDCSEGEAAAIVNAYSGDMASSHHYEVYVGTKLLESTRFGLIDRQTVENNKSEYGTPRLGNMGTCLERFGPRFVSKQDASVKVVFSTLGIVTDETDKAVVHNIFKHFNYQ